MAVLTCQSGAILVEAGTLLPAGLSLQSSALSHTWRSVADLDRAGIETAITKAGWSFFFMAGVIKKHAFGFDEEKQVRRAVRRLTNDAASQNCNCVEILGLTAKSFLGVPYVTVVAHARHIQPGSLFRAGAYGDASRGAKDFEHAFPETIGNASSRSAARQK